MGQRYPYDRSGYFSGNDGERDRTAARTQLQSHSQWAPYGAFVTTGPQWQSNDSSLGNSTDPEL